MKTFLAAMLAAVLISGSALAQNAMSSSNSMSSPQQTSNMSGGASGSMNKPDPHKKKTDKKDAKSTGAMSGQNNNAMSGGNMSGPSQPH